MRLIFPMMMAILVGASALAQEPGLLQPTKRAAIEGLVTKEPGSEPVKKALIELIAENQTEGGDYTAITGADGAFRIENILPGRYRLFAERTGFLDADKNRGHLDGRVLTLTAGQELKDIRIQVQAAAVVRGRVTDEDGEPLANAEVTVLRQTFVAGHRRWEPAGADRTNDLGEYRVANLAAGNVYVSVSPPPDFKTLIEAGGAGSETRAASSGDKPATAYQTTYYPGTQDRSQAAPLQLHPGDEFPVNFSLMPGPSLSIRGSVVNLPPKTSATIMLQSRDFSVVMNGAEMYKDGSFVIHDVSPGNYTIVATVDGAAVPMTAQQALQIGSSNIDGLRLAPQPGATVRGRLRLETKNGAGGFDPERTSLRLQPTQEGEEDALTVERFSDLAHVGLDGSFEWKDVPSGNYGVQIVHEGGVLEDWYVKAVLVGGRDMNDPGITVSGGALWLDLVASTNGGIVEGVVTDSKGEPSSSAVVVAVPEARMRGRVDRYRKTISDQSGRFTLRGLRPGDYTVLAWESIDGEAYYNPEFLKAYEGQGISVKIGEGERKSLQLPAIVATENEQ